MPCESYQDALTSAAAGAPPTLALRSHLIDCADCRAALAAEESLFAGIDAGLRSVANAELPPSLIPSVRARLEESAPRRRWLAPMLIPAAAALVLVFFIVRSLHVPTPKSPAPIAIASTTEPPRTSLSGSTVPFPPPPSANSSAASVSRAFHGLVPRMAATVEKPPEVLVPRDQEVLLASYARQWRTHKYLRLTTELIRTPSLEPLEIAPIQIDVRDVKLLTESDSR